LGQRAGILVPITFKQLRPSATREEMTQAHVLGWVVELVRASHSLINEIVGLKRAKDQQPKQTTWAEKHGLGSMAVNDALLLQHGVHVVMRNYFMVHIL
jgi:farnesyl diphosphate synthase